MPLLTLHDLTASFGGPPLMEGANLQVEPGERIGLLGRNGTGKSTLLRIIDGRHVADEGEVRLAPGATTALLTQDVPQELPGTIFDQVTAGLGEAGRLLAEYHAVGVRLARGGEGSQLAELERLEHVLHAAGHWQAHRQVERVLSDMNLPPDVEVRTLSAGMRRRVLLAKAIAGNPDVLLLDEPTNHLDVRAIGWLEEFLARYDKTLIFVTHDRMFLRKLATRIVELDRGQLTSWACDYEKYIERKEADLQARATREALFDKKLAQEEVWIRQGIKARRTRNEGRVRALEQLREMRSQRRERVGTVRMQLQEAQRSGRLVIEAKGITFGYDERPIVRDFSTLVMRGDKIGVIGPNGVGKTTLLRLLLAELAPQEGTVRHGTHIEVAYFDQLHGKLDEEQSVLENVSDGTQFITTAGGKKKHIYGYLQDFLFSPDDAHRAIKRLSGGERNRVLLAKLFAKPSNVLVMDEPTNDLDVETLELLENLLIEYPGTVLLVSHDREFLNNVVTSTFVCQGDGVVKEYAGGYDDWVRQSDAEKPQEPASDSADAAGDKPSKKSKPQPPTRDRPRKLSYKEQRELDELPQRIEALETEQGELHVRLADPSFYQQEGGRIAEATSQFESIEAQLAEAYGRWESLESLR